MKIRNNTHKVHGTWQLLKRVADIVVIVVVIGRGSHIIIVTDNINCQYESTNELGAMTFSKKKKKKKVRQ